MKLLFCRYSYMPHLLLKSQICGISAVNYLGSFSNWPSVTNWINKGSALDIQYVKGQFIQLQDKNLISCDQLWLRGFGFSSHSRSEAFCVWFELCKAPNGTFTTTTVASLCRNYLRCAMIHRESCFLSTSPSYLLIIHLYDYV